MNFTQSSTLYDNAIDADAFLKEYDDMLLGKRKNFSAALLDRENESNMCAHLLRRIFDKYFHWTPVQIRDCLTPEIATRMCLWPFINRLECPPEVIRDKELFFVAWVLYPETKNITDVDLVLRVYDNLMTGKIMRFPKNYFDTYTGTLRAKIIFKTFFCEYLLPQRNFTSLEEVYMFFVSSEINSILDKYKLTTLVRQKFDIPLNFLHSGLDIEQNNTFYVRALNTCPVSKWVYCRLEDHEVLEANGGVMPEKMAQYLKRVAEKGTPYYDYRKRKGAKKDEETSPVAVEQTAEKKRGRKPGKSVFSEPVDDIFTSTDNDVVLEMTEDTTTTD